MNSRSLGATKVFAWPTAEIAVMGPVGAVRILKRRELAAAPEEERAELEHRLAEEHEKLAGGLTRAREAGDVDEGVKHEENRGATAKGPGHATPGRRAPGDIP